MPAAGVTGRPCPRHGGDLRRGEVCQACVLEPATPGAEQSSSELDNELLAEAAECQTRARLLWRHAEELLEDGTAMDKSTGAKLSAESAKWIRLAREIKGEVSQRRQVRDGLSDLKAMSGARGPH
jgi:hypothetical protein